MAAELPTYIPVAEATEKYRVGRRELNRLVDSGRVRAVKINGGIAVAEEDVRTTTKRDELWTQVEQLQDVPIGIKEASEKYHLAPTSIYGWIRHGYVRVIDDQRTRGRGRKRTLNEADVAYIALVAEERGRRPGKRIITPEFVPPHSIA
jgi:predicted site-specific integrase-resolvase